MNVLNPDMLYPLYDADEQTRQFNRGNTTHKMPDEMNRRERRMIMARERRDYMKARRAKQRVAG